MKDQTKYILIGICIGVVVGIIIFYLLITFRVVQPFGFGGFRGFPQNNNLTNFPKPLGG